jgi:hypothetical protein
VIDYDGIGNVRNYKEQLINRPPSVFYIDDLGNMYLGYGAQEKFKVSKIYPNGNHAWSDMIPTNLTFGSTGDAVKSVLADSLGNVYVTGMHFGNLTNSEFLTVKYSSSGVKLWSKRFTNNRQYSADIPRTIVLDKFLNVYVFGQSIITVNQDSTVNFIMVKYDYNGNEEGNIYFDRTINDNFNALSALLDNSHNIYISGIAYNITSISGNNNSFTTTMKFSDINYLLSTHNFVEHEKIVVFPNPSNSLLHIKSKTDDWNRYKIFSLSGNVISEGWIYDKTIHIAELSTGEFLIELSNTEHERAKLQFVKH